MKKFKNKIKLPSGAIATLNTDGNYYTSSSIYKDLKSLDKLNKKPLTSGAALLLAQDEHMEKLTPATKIAMIQELLGGPDQCPTCGHVTDRPAIITPEQAKELLGFKEEE